MKARLLGAALAPSFLIYLAAVNIVVFTLSVTIPDDPHPFLDEWGPVSILSGCQLLICGFLALEIHKSRPAWIWKLIGWGFFFLCADEMLQLHESSDRVIHWILGVEPTRITNHFDDVIVGLYGLAGLVALFAGRAEIVFFIRQWWLFALGFIGFAVMVAFDLMGGELGALWSYLDVPARQGKMWAEVVEEGFKLAGGFFCVAALRKCWDGLWLPSSRARPNAQAVPAE